VVAVLLLAAAVACSDLPPRGTADPPAAVASSAEGAAPPDTVIVVYTHGSGPAAEPDACELHRDGWPGTPHVLAHLDLIERGGRVIRLRRYCTPTRTGIALGDLHRAGDPRGLAQSKVMRRSADLLALAREYREEGVPAQNIILTGHSAGGFAALLAQMHDPEAVGRVVAFAPAFANTREVRSPGEAWARQILNDRIAQADGLDALIFLFEDDPYERREDLESWQANPGLRIEALGGSAIDAVACSSSNTHRLAFDECFTATQLERLADFILR
jgi:pimeloyl-ACP methyl ester carboxylesterase